jgi:hypothetical protein
LVRIIIYIFLLVTASNTAKAVPLVLSKKDTNKETAPRVIIFLYPCLRTSDLQNPDLPAISKMASASGIGLLSYPANPSGDTFNACATIPLGESQPDLWNTWRDGWPHTTYSSVMNTFQLTPQKFWKENTAPSQLLGQQIINANLSNSVIVVYPSGPRMLTSAALLLMDQNGDTPAQLLHSFSVHDGSGDWRNPRVMEIIDKELGRWRDKYADKSLFFVFSPFPDEIRKGFWQRLSPILISYSDKTTGLLTSDSTRSPGIVSTLDISPTILYDLGSSRCNYYTGHHSELIHAISPLRRVSLLDNAIWINARALVPIGSMHGFLAALIIISGLILYLSGHKNMRPWAFGSLFLLSLPAAMLISAMPLLAGWIHSARELALSHIFCMLAFATLASAASYLFHSQKIIERQNHPSLIFIGLTTITIILIDSFTGQNMIRFSMLSDYQLSGIRFYGIGNEYMGFLIGLTLLTAFVIPWKANSSMLIFLPVLLVLCHPSLGAKGGAALTATTAFGMGWSILAGKKHGWRQAIMYTCIGIFLALGIAYMDKMLLHHAASHLGGALQGAQSRGSGYIIEIIERKVLMNLRLSFAPGMIWTYAGLSFTAFMTRKRFNEILGTLKRNQPRWYHSLPAVGWAALSAWIFNDSGAVAAIFLIAIYITSGFYLLCIERTQESQTATNEI